jgi:hypothetical protein
MIPSYKKKWRGTWILHVDMTISKKLPRVSNGFEICCGEWSAQRTTSQSFKQWEENFTQHWTTFVRFWHWVGSNSGPLRVVVFKLCAALLWGAVRNLKGAENFFRKDEILQFFYRNLLGVPRKTFGLFQGAPSQKVWKPLPKSLNIQSVMSTFPLYQRGSPFLQMTSKTFLRNPQNFFFTSSHQGWQTLISVNLRNSAISLN